MQLLARIVWRDSWSIYETAHYFVSGKGSKNAEQLGIRSHRGGETLAVMPIQNPTEFHGDWWQNGTQKDGEPGKRGGGPGKGSSRDDSSSSASSSSSSPSSTSSSFNFCTSDPDAHSNNKTTTTTTTTSAINITTSNTTSATSEMDNTMAQGYETLTVESYPSFEAYEMLTVAPYPFAEAYEEHVAKRPLMRPLGKGFSSNDMGDGPLYRHNKTMAVAPYSDWKSWTGAGSLCVLYSETESESDGEDDCPNLSDGSSSDEEDLDSDGDDSDSDFINNTPATSRVHYGTLAVLHSDSESDSEDSDTIYTDPFSSSTILKKFINFDFSYDDDQWGEDYEPSSYGPYPSVLACIVANGGGGCIGKQVVESEAILRAKRLGRKEGVTMEDEMDIDSDWSNEVKHNPRPVGSQTTTSHKPQLYPIFRTKRRIKHPVSTINCPKHKLTMKQTSHDASKLAAATKATTATSTPDSTSTSAPTRSPPYLKRGLLPKISLPCPNWVTKNPEHQAAIYNTLTARYTEFNHRTTNFSNPTNLQLLLKNTSVSNKQMSTQTMLQSTCKTCDHIASSQLRNISIGNIPSCICRGTLRYKGKENEGNRQSLLHVMCTPEISSVLSRYKWLTKPDLTSSAFTVDKKRTMRSLKENGQRATFYMKCSTCDEPLEVKFLTKKDRPPKCPGCLGKGVTSIQRYHDFFDPANPLVPANRAAEGPHAYQRMYHPNIKDPAMKALANIMGPQTYKEFKAAFPMKRTTIRSSIIPIKAFWCRDCQGVLRPPEAHLVSCSLGHLRAGQGIQCSCRKSVMERIGKALLKSSPEYEDVKEQTPIETMSPRTQKLDHTFAYKGYRAVIEWDGGQHFADCESKFESTFKYLNKMDKLKLNAIHDGIPVRGRKVKLLVRMAYTKPHKIPDKVKELFQHLKLEVEDLELLTPQKLKDDKVIFICLPKDKKKYTEFGLPKERNKRG